MSVDLPEPDGPMVAVNSPGHEVDGDPVEGVDHGVALAVGLAGVERPCGDGTASRGAGGRSEVLGRERAVAELRTLSIICGFLPIDTPGGRVGHRHRALMSCSGPEASLTWTSTVLVRAVPRTVIAPGGR